MKKIVINNCIGGYCLSEEAYEYLGMEWDGFGFAYGLERDDERLVKCVEELGERANGDSGNLKIVAIPDDVKCYVYENEMGYESVHEVHRVWSCDDEGNQREYITK